MSGVILLGFENAPVSKGIIEIIGVSTIFLLLFPISNILCFPYIFPYIFPNFQIWRIFTNLLFFQSFIEGLFGILLLYNFREIERRFGSKKFTIFIFYVTFISLLLQFGVMSFISYSNPSGPYSLIFSLSFFFITNIPYTDRFSFMGIYCSNKIYMYLLLLQFIFFNSYGSIIQCICGILACIIYKYDLLIKKDKLFLPYFIQRFGLYIAPHIGINLQPRQRRQQQVFSPQRQHQILRPPQNINNNNNNRQIHQNILQQQVLPSQENITTVQNMGFSRQQAEFALQMHGNNVQLAANFLLGLQ